ncbi:hypothetical protein SNEBB_010865 [Seison nebaliae]|nr:hypothetical protein SNEBB_010865 [Seison nebaliae]
MKYIFLLFLIVCQIDRFFALCNFDALDGDKAESLPKFPESFDAIIEISESSRQKVMVVNEKYDSRTNAARLNYIKDDEVLSVLYDFEHNDLIQRSGDTCQVTKISDAPFNVFIGSKAINASYDKVFNSKSLFFLNTDWKYNVVSMGGENLPLFSTCYKVASMNLDVQLNLMVKEYPGKTYSVPRQLIAMGSYKDDDGKVVEFSNTYNYVSFIESVHNELGAFQLNGAYCENKTPTIAVPKMKYNYFAFAMETKKDEINFFDTSYEYYDYNEKLFRWDKLVDLSTGFETVIHDERMGLAYIINSTYLSCQIKTIDVQSPDVLPNEMDPHKIIMRNPQAFFYMEKGDWYYEGKFMVRGVLCDAWIGKRKVDDAIYTIWEWFIMSDSVAESDGPNFDFNNPVRAVVTTYIPDPVAGTQTIRREFNLNHFTTEEPDISKFDVGLCYRGKMVRHFMISLDGTYVDNVQMNKALFLLECRIALQRATNLTSLRISNIEIDYTENNIDVIFTLLDVPTQDGNVVEKEKQIPLNVAIRNLKETVKSNRFIVTTVGKKDKKKQFLVALPKSLAEVERLPKKTKFLIKDFSAGALAGMGIAMVVIGMLIGMGVLYGYEKITNKRYNGGAQMRTKMNYFLLLILSYGFLHVNADCDYEALPGIPVTTDQLPKLPDRFSSVVEVSQMEQKTVIVASETYDYKLNYLRTDLMKDGTVISVLYDYSKDIVTIASGDACSKKKIEDFKFTDLIGFNKFNLTSTHVFNTKSIFFPDTSKPWKMSEIDNVKGYSNCLVRDNGNYNAKIEIFFDPTSDGLRPRLSRVSGANEQTKIDDVYYFVQFVTGIHNEFGTFQYNGKFCDKAAKGKALPNIDYKYFSVMFEQKIDSLLTFRPIKQYYDYNQQLFRLDESESVVAAPTINVHDLRLGVQYEYNTTYGSCRIRTLDQNVATPDFTVDNGQIKMKDPKTFFFLKKGDFYYEGEAIVRDTLVDVWIGKYDEDDTNTLFWEWFFTPPNTVADLTEVLPAIPLRAKVTKIRKFPNQFGEMDYASTTVEYNIHSMILQEPDISVFDVGRCYSPSMKRHFMVSLPIDYKEAILLKKEFFVYECRIAIQAASNLTSLRVSNIELDYTTTDIIVIFTLLERLDIGETTNIVVYPRLNEAIRSLKASVKSSKFIVPIVTDLKTEKTKFIVARSNSLEEISRLPNSYRSKDKPHKNSKVGGVAAGMLILGLLLGIVVAFLVVKFDFVPSRRVPQTSGFRTSIVLDPNSNDYSLN